MRGDEACCVPRGSQVLTMDKEVMAKFYEPWAFVHANAEALPQMVGVMQPLGIYSYQLSLDYELSRWDLH